MPMQTVNVLPSQPLLFQKKAVAADRGAMLLKLQKLRHCAQHAQQAELTAAFAYWASSLAPASPPPAPISPPSSSSPSTATASLLRQASQGKRTLQQLDALRRLAEHEPRALTERALEQWRAFVGSPPARRPPRLSIPQQAAANGSADGEGSNGARPTLGLVLPPREAPQMSMLAPRADVGMRAPTARFGGSTARGGAETFRGDGSETARGGRNPFAAGASPDSHRGGRATWRTPRSDGLPTWRDEHDDLLREGPTGDEGEEEAMAEAAMEAAEAAAAAAAAEAAMEASLGSAKDAVAVSRADLATLVEYARAARGRVGSPATSLGAATPSERRLSADAGAADAVAADGGGPQLLSVAADDLRTLMDSVAALRAEQRASKAEIGSLRRGWEHARLRRLAGALACPRALSAGRAMRTWRAAADWLGGTAAQGRRLAEAEAEAAARGRALKDAREELKSQPAQFERERQLLQRRLDGAREDAAAAQEAASRLRATLSELQAGAEAFRDEGPGAEAALRQRIAQLTAHVAELEAGAPRSAESNARDAAEVRVLQRALRDTDREAAAAGFNPALAWSTPPAPVRRPAPFSPAAAASSMVVAERPAMRARALRRVVLGRDAYSCGLAIAAWRGAAAAVAMREAMRADLMKARRTSVDVKGRLKDQRSKLKDVTSAAEEAEEAQAALRTEVHRLRTERDALKTAQAHGKEAAAQLKSVRAERDRLAAAVEQSKGRTASTAAQSRGLLDRLRASFLERVVPQRPPKGQLNRGRALGGALGRWRRAAHALARGGAAASHIPLPRAVPVAPGPPVPLSARVAVAHGRPPAAAPVTPAAPSAQPRRPTAASLSPPLQASPERPLSPKSRAAERAEAERAFQRAASRAAGAPTASAAASPAATAESPESGGGWISKLFGGHSWSRSADGVEKHTSPRVKHGTAASPRYASPARGAIADRGGTDSPGRRRGSTGGEKEKGDPRERQKAREKAQAIKPQPPSAAELAALRKLVSAASAKDGTLRLDSVSLYSLGKLLGKGAFGAVKVGVHKLSGAVVAIKNFKKSDIKSEVEQKGIEREIKIMKAANHQHVIRLYEVIDSPTNYYLVMECAPNGDLGAHLEKVRRLGEADAAKFLVQTASAVAHCHGRGVVHRDLKPENLLLDGNMDIKLTDFGLSALVKPGVLLKVPCGTPAYSAPELISRQPYDGTRADVWSLGVLLYQMLHGTLPFHDTKHIRAGDYSVSSQLVPAAALPLLRHMLTVAPKERATLEAVEGHGWLQTWRSSALRPPPRRFGLTHTDADAGLVETIVERFGLDGAHVTASLRDGAFNHATATYLLLEERKG